jgi:hypothetical protein
LRNSVKLLVGAGGFAKAKAVLTPFNVPVGTSASTKTAFDSAALRVFTVAVRLVRELPKFVTKVLRPSTVVFRALSELVCPVTVEVRAPRLLVSVEIEFVWPLTVEPRPFTEAERLVRVAPFVPTVELKPETVEFKPVTVVPRPVTVVLKLSTVVWRVLMLPLDATLAARSLT